LPPDNTLRDLRMSLMRVARRGLQVCRNIA
jgi:hypothetical protein